MNRPLRYALVGDGDSPHLAKWARTLAPRVELWVVSSRGACDELAACVPPERMLLLQRRPSRAGGNAGLLSSLPRMLTWLARVDPDWINPHYLTSHGTLAWAAKRLGRLRGQLLGSAWGSDILVAPTRNLAYLEVTRRVLRACRLATSDSQHMARRMLELGAREVMTFPFGMDALPARAFAKSPGLFFANRALEPLYKPLRVIEVFADIAAAWPDARLAVANDGSLRPLAEARAAALGLAGRVTFLGTLDPAEQDAWYGRAQWYLSLPASDSVSVSVIEAMSHGCVPLLSDLPANRELVQSGRNGLVLGERPPAHAELAALLARAEEIAGANTAWVARHGLFPPAIDRLLQRLAELAATPAGQEASA